MRPKTAKTPEEDASIDILASQIRRHRALYYGGEPEISDAEFDALEDRLRALSPEHEVLAEVGALEGLTPAQTMGAHTGPAPAQGAPYSAEAEKMATSLRQMNQALYDQTSTDAEGYRTLWHKLRSLSPGHPILDETVPPKGQDWPKARHEIPMGSLNKVNSVDELTAWAEKCDLLAKEAGVNPISADLVLTEKLDGLSLEVVYERGTLKEAITRGNGVVGERITPNVRAMKGVPAEISQKARISVRGEIILKKSDAEGLLAFRRTVDPSFTELKNLRNAASGLSRIKDPTLLGATRFLSVLFYDLEPSETLTTEREKLEAIRALGFETPGTQFGTTESLAEVWRRYGERKRKQLDYDIDGLVIRANNLHTATILGELNHRPRAGIAFKFGNEMQVTTLKDILWSTGDTGRITPIAQIEPVFLAGAEVKQASLHNLARIKELKIGKGDQVLVSRRNDVIPYVENVVVKGPKQERAPKVCQVCRTAVSSAGEYLVCPNPDCPARRVGRLKTWVRQLGLMEWGEKTLERLYTCGLVQEPKDLYQLKEQDIAALEGFGEVSARKLLTPLNQQKTLPLATFIAALGIETISKETAKLLVRAGYDSIEAIAEAEEEALSAIDGLGSLKASRIVEGLRTRLPEIERLKKVGVEPVHTLEAGPLVGLSFCFSGAQSKPRKVLHELVEQHGGSIASTVKKGLSYLVLADASSSSSKAQKARKLGVQIIDGNHFFALLEPSSKPEDS